MTLYFKGIIRNIRYQSFCFPTVLGQYSLADFDINRANGYGVIDLGEQGNMVGFSKWISPKRTRSYPFARIYNTYHLPKKITIIPVIKDEGIKGDNDRINFITLSWMNLLNVYIILAWYDRAIIHRNLEGKITEQAFDSAYIQGKINTIKNYHQTALHWNIDHFQQDFRGVYQQAITSYQTISEQTQIKMHSSQGHIKKFAQFLENDTFSIERFKNATLPHSYKAAMRELSTKHRLEHISFGEKAYFSIINNLGGEYHLTADEVYFSSEDKLIIQEAKNASAGGEKCECRNFAQRRGHPRRLIQTYSFLEHGRIMA